MMRLHSQLSLILKFYAIVFIFYSFKLKLKRKEKEMSFPMQVAPFSELKAVREKLRFPGKGNLPQDCHMDTRILPEPSICWPVLQILDLAVNCGSRCLQKPYECNLIFVI